MDGKFDGMYMDHPSNKKHYECEEEKQSKRESYKRAGPILQGIVKIKTEIEKA